MISFLFFGSGMAEYLPYFFGRGCFGEINQVENFSELFHGELFRRDDGAGKNERGDEPVDVFHGNALKRKTKSSGQFLLYSQTKAG